MFFTSTIPAFLASDAIIGTLALIGWIFIVAAFVWLGEKSIEKFLRRTATRAKTLAPSSEASPEKLPAGITKNPDHTTSVGKN